MDKIGYSAIIIILCMLCTFPFAVGDGGQNNRLEAQERQASFPAMLTSMFSASTTFLTSASSSSWDKVKTIINQGTAYLFPPNLDFRSGDEAEANADGGAGMKVKEAVTKSLGKSKATVEDSAKSAAKIASETAKKTKEKVRNSFSEREAEMRCEL